MVLGDTVHLRLGHMDVNHHTAQRVERILRHTPCGISRHLLRQHFLTNLYQIVLAVYGSVGEEFCHNKTVEPRKR